MLGCNESNIIFQQHLCKLGQLWRSKALFTAWVLELVLNWFPMRRVDFNLVSDMPNEATQYSVHTIQVCIIIQYADVWAKYAVYNMQCIGYTICNAEGIHIGL